MNLRQLRIGTRLALGFGAILVAMAAVNVVGTVLSKKSRDDLARVQALATEKERLAEHMKETFLQQASTLRGIALHADLKTMQAEEDRSRKLSKDYDALAERMLKQQLAAEEKSIVQRLAELDNSLSTPLMQAMGLAAAYQGEEAARVITGQIDPLMAKAIAELDKLIELQQKANINAIAASTAQGDRTANVVLGANALMLILAALAAWLVSRSITRPLGESVRVVKQVAAGNLATKIEVSGRDEPAEVLGALRE